MRNIDELKQFASDLQLMKHRASELGLYRTMQKLEIPVTEVGYEIADMLMVGRQFKARGVTDG